jgi:hypothetical protein
MSRLLDGICNRIAALLGLSKTAKGNILIPS